MEGSWLYERQRRVGLIPTASVLEFELGFPAEFADWSAAGQNLATQLDRLRYQDHATPCDLHAVDARRAEWPLPAWYPRLGRGQPTSTLPLHRRSADLQRAGFARTWYVAESEADSDALG